MKTLQLKTFRIASKLVLDPIIQYFGHPLSGNGNSCIILDNSQVTYILKHNAADIKKQAFLFDFGSIVLLDFDSDEVRTFLQFLDSLVCNIDYSMFAKFHERHTLELYPEGIVSLWKGSSTRIKYDDTVIALIAEILAKSTALKRTEYDLDILLDEAEIFINRLQAGRLKANSKAFAAICAKLLRIEYEITAGIGIFDRPECHGRSKAQINVYDILAEYYELASRLKILERKAGELRNIVGSYSGISYNRQERRLILFEVFLLALFPVSYLKDILIAAFNNLFG